MKSRVLSSLRKAVRMCQIFLGFKTSHEIARSSVPDIPESVRMESSGYFSYDAHHVNVVKRTFFMTSH